MPLVAFAADGDQGYEFVALLFKPGSEGPVTKIDDRFKGVFGQGLVEFCQCRAEWAFLKMNFLKLKVSHNYHN